MRQKKRKLTNHNSLLHSDKSTYFYKGTLGKLFLRVQLFCHKGLYPGWRGSKSRPERSERFDFESTTKARWQNSGHVQKTVIALPAFALLGLVTYIINPCYSSSTEKTYAAESTQDPDFSITLSLNDNVVSEEQLDTGVVGYIANNFTVSSNAVESYSIYLKPAAGSTSSLQGKEHQQLIPSVSGDVSVSNFTNNTWGYSVDSVDVSNSDLTYSAIPTGSTPIKTITNPDDGDDTYKIVFAAKINDDKPTDHYQSQMELSVVATAKQVTASLGNITKMSELTQRYCTDNIPTPAVDATLKDIPMGQLIDDRDGADGQTYWVAKFADGDCWMTQNMAYTGSTLTSQTGNFNKTKIGTILVPDSVTAPTSYTETNIGSLKPSSDSTMSAVTTSTKYNAHYSTGVYYTKDQAVSVCSTLGGGWQLPTSPSTASASAAHGSFSRLLGVYSVANNSDGSTKLRTAPFYFLYSGYYNSDFSDVGSHGYYWSTSLSSGSNYYRLYLTSYNANAQFSNIASYGLAVRCVVPGA